MVVKKSWFAACLILLTVQFRQIEFPQAKISNGIINAVVPLPDATTGYYRGTRFDWAGQISELTYKGHNYFGRWFPDYDPYLHDAIMGPVESFDPIGYDDATTGNGFLKIGIGILKKPAEDRYFFAKKYDVSNGGKWTTKNKTNKVTFVHNLNDTEFSYQYTKTLELTNGKPELVISHVLKNTGKRTLETNVMNHNFFVIDTQVTSSDFVISFPFEITGARRDTPNASTISGRQILLEDGDPKGKNFFLGDIKGYTQQPNDYNIDVRNLRTGSGVTVTADRPLSKLAFWATVKTVCPEPFIHIKAEPGKEVTWKLVYTFYADTQYPKRNDQ